MSVITTQLATHIVDIIMFVYCMYRIHSIHTIVNKVSKANKKYINLVILGYIIDIFILMLNTRIFTYMYYTLYTYNIRIIYLIISKYR